MPMATEEKTSALVPQEEGARRSADSLVEAYKKDVDRTLLRANLKLTPEQRLLNLQAFIDAMEELRRAVKTARVCSTSPH